MKFEQLKPGMTVYDVRSHRMGATTLRSVGVWKVRVIEVHEDRSITAAWNGNAPSRMRERQWSKYRLKAPELEHSVTGRTRIKKRTRPSKNEEGQSS